MGTPYRLTRDSIKKIVAKVEDIGERYWQLKKDFCNGRELCSKCKSPIYLNCDAVGDFEKGLPCALGNIDVASRDLIELERKIYCSNEPFVLKSPVVDFSKMSLNERLMFRST